LVSPLPRLQAFLKKLSRVRGTGGSYRGSYQGFAAVHEDALFKRFVPQKRDGAAYRLLFAMRWFIRDVVSASADALRAMADKIF
jgi:hypothetical protein